MTTDDGVGSVQLVERLRIVEQLDGKITEPIAGNTERDVVESDNSVTLARVVVIG